VYVAMGMRHPGYAYGSDLHPSKGESTINKGKLEKLTTMGSRCNGPPKCLFLDGFDKYRYTIILRLLNSTMEPEITALQHISTLKRGSKGFIV
jgi:hypothetical protein